MSGGAAKGMILFVLPRFASSRFAHLSEETRAGMAGRKLDRVILTAGSTANCRSQEMPNRRGISEEFQLHPSNGPYSFADR